MRIVQRSDAGIVEVALGFRGYPEQEVATVGEKLRKTMRPFVPSGVETGRLGGDAALCIDLEQGPTRLRSEDDDSRARPRAAPPVGRDANVLDASGHRDPFEFPLGKEGDVPGIRRPERVG